VDRLAGLDRLDGVASAYAGTRDGIDTLLRDRGLRKTAPELTAESLLRGAHASAVLDGSTSSLDDVRAGRGDATAQAAVRVSVELLSLAPVLGRSPLQALARIHALAGMGTLPDDELGRPRDGAAADRLRQALGVLDDDAPALVTAAVVHGELLVGQPFTSYNGIVARAAERLVLVGRGVDEKSLTVPEAGHLALRAEYESNARAAATGTRSGWHAWLLYCAEAYAAGAEASPLHR
jgi:hypothetical protein